MMEAKSPNPLSTVSRLFLAWEMKCGWAQIGPNYDFKTHPKSCTNHCTASARLLVTRALRSLGAKHL